MTPSFAVSDTFTAPVDPEHSAIRLTVIGLFIVGWALSFFALNAVISSQGLNILAILLSFGLTALITQQIERVLKRRWPSGRILQAADGRIQLARGRHVQQEIRTGQQVNVLTWRFTIRRRSRVPKGWYMVGCALEQDDVYIPVYTFMSPQTFDELNAGGYFTPLVSRKELDSGNAAQGDLRLAGEQRRLHMAENARWNNGAEMTVDDFKRYLIWLQGRFPQWMPAVL